MCSETQTRKITHFFPLFLEHLPQEEEAHPRTGSSLTFPLTLPQVLTNYLHIEQDLPAASGAGGSRRLHSKHLARQIPHWMQVWI